MDVFGRKRRVAEAQLAQAEATIVALREENQALCTIVEGALTQMSQSFVYTAQALDARLDSIIRLTDSLPRTAIYLTQGDGIN